MSEKTDAFEAAATSSIPIDNGEGSKLFQPADYAVFSISLAVPLAIGVFFFFYHRNKATVDDFLVGGRSINFVAVALSLLASLLNGLFVIGTPAEVHYNGIEVSLVVIGLGVAAVIAAQLFIPKYHSMKLTSAYEYIERRYNYPTRVVASLLFCASMIFFMAIVLYVPALAFAQVTRVNVFATIVITGGICIIYTTIGGIKAVVWTDAVQMIILLLGLVIIAIIGCSRVGGGAEVWRIAVETGRSNLNDFSFDPRERHTVWTQIIGSATTYFGVYVSNQMMVQRYMSVSKTWQAQASGYISLLMFLPLLVLILIIGLALHAAYYRCDPLITRQISSADQIMAYYIVDTMGSYPGVAGLLTASVFAAALSSVSSVINSLSAVCLEDFVCPAVKRFKGSSISDQSKRRIAVILSI